MIPLLNRESVRAVDREAIDNLHVPGLVLMENAGLGATQVLLREFEGDAVSEALILGGVGQNGGDAWVVARQLLTRGIRPRCVLVGDPNKVRGDARVNLDALRALGIEPEPCVEGAAQSLLSCLESARLLVDGLFGTGLDRDIEGFYAHVIQSMLAAEKPVFALDLPSGLDADTGQVRGICVRARCTATFAAHKPGLHQFPGVELAGRVFAIPIGVPATLSSWGLIEARDVAQALPRRPLNSHKGASGRVAIFAGAPGKTGAAVLSATAALRAGAGLVTIACDLETQRALDPKVTEVMTLDLLSSRMEQAERESLAFAGQQHAAVLGPGFGLDAERTRLSRALALSLPVPTVLDADALTALSSDGSQLVQALASRVLTPHPGEAARLLGQSVPAIEADRYRHAQKLAELTGQVVVLKGARTVIAAPDGRLRVCASGTPALATGGTGDVLSGVIGALLVSLDAFTAAWVGVELHARAGALAAPFDRGLLAGEVAPRLAEALESCRLEASAAPRA